jgi:hypothetical protein
VPADGAFARTLAASASPEDLLNTSGGAELDRWQAQVLGRVLQRAQVWMYSDGLTDADLRSAHLTPVGNLSEAVREAVAAVGGSGRIGVLPEGPLTVATVGPPT